MNQNFIYCAIFFISVIFSSCHRNSCCGVTNDGKWVKRADFPGVARSESSSFVVGNYAYVGTGVDNNFNRLNDLWQYDPVKNSWEQEANLPGVARSSAVGLTVSNYGYLGTGYTGTNILKDFWQYNPENNTWTQKSNLAGSERYEAVAFGIQNLGYIATGFDTSSLRDCWEYNPDADTWKQKSDLKGNARWSAVAFVHNQFGYIVTGLTDNGSMIGDFWKFDPSQPDSNAWTQLRNIYNSDSAPYDDIYTTIMRANATAFVILNVKSEGGGDFAYLTTGINGSLNKWTWEYNFANDLWIPKTQFVGDARQGGVSFSVLNRGFTGGGENESGALEDFWEFDPNQPNNR